MRAAEWVGLIAGLIAILGAFVAALRWTVHQFVQEIGNQLFQRMDRHQENMERLQGEIVGLRTETARLLDLLFNQRNQEDNPN